MSNEWIAIYEEQEDGGDGTETAGDPKPTGIWDGSDGRMYPHLLPTDDFISQLEHRILETVANSIQIQQDAEDENDKKKYAMQK